MSFLNYKRKLVLTNIIIYSVIMLSILFIVLQVTWFISVNNLKGKMLQTGADLNLYLQEKTAEFVTDEQKEEFILNNCSDLYNVFSNYSECRIELFDYYGEIITADINSNETILMTDEYEEALATKEPVMSIRTNNGRREIWMMVPLLSNSSTVLSFAGLIMPLAQADSTQWLIFEILGIGFLLGLIAITIASIKLSASFVKPIKKLTEISTEINEGDYDKIIYYKKKDEIGELTSVYNQMVQNLNKVIIQLRSERRRLGNVLASLDDGVIAINEDGDVLLTNKYTKLYFDIAEPKTIFDFQYLDFLTDIYNKLKAGRSNVSQEVEVNGRILLITGSPIKSEVAEENYLIIIRNITTNRNLEKEQRKFISSVSHELRTPLTTIIGYTDMLNRRNITDSKLIKSSLNTINKEGHRLVRLVDDLLNANSVENMNFSVHKKLIDLNQLVNQVVEQMRVKSWSKEIEIVYKAEENLPLIYGDYDRLSQIVINVIHNAIKFSSVGGKIDVTLTREDEQYLSLSIRDYGVGIDPAKKDFIFSAFYRADEDRARKEGEGGAGLGLYLVKQVVDKHDGRITVDSEVDEGTNITILLPVKDEDIDITEVI